MSTYENCYGLVAAVRHSVGEFSEAKVRGEDTLGGYHNDYIVTKINAAIRELYALISRRVPDLFIEETQLTAVNSVFTLPWDFAKVVYFKNADGLQVYEMDQWQRKLTDATGSEMLYRRVGNTLILDKTGVTKTYTLVYKRKPRKIHHGLVVTGSSMSMTFCQDAPKVADYFNGMTVENISADWVDTISDYTAARVATIAAETPVKNEAYGLVPEIPDWAHFLIAPRATLMVRQEHPLTKRKPTPADFNEYRELLRTTLLEFTAPSSDEDMQNVFSNFAPIGTGIAI